MSSEPSYGRVQLVVATQNPGKLREIRSLLRPHFWFSDSGVPPPGVIGLELSNLSQHPKIALPEESFDTFAENARQKAEHVSAAIGAPALGDDSGLCVDALFGRPGVHSARYAAGPDSARIQKLLDELAEVPDEGRTARFVCVLALAAPRRRTVSCEGEVLGRILRAPRGSNGFGYDPVFAPLDAAAKGRTMAELDEDEKDQLSHRARAVFALVPHLNTYLTSARTG